VKLLKQKETTAKPHGAPARLKNQENDSRHLSFQDLDELPVTASLGQRSES
jgi:hypothetical protein